MATNIIFTEAESKMLNALGRSSFAEPLLSLIDKMKSQMSEIDDITGDYAAAVEGRKLFKKLIGELGAKIKVTDKPKREQKGNDDYS